MPEKKNLKIALSQFPVSRDIRQNMNYITRQIVSASRGQADVIHFPELALSGYETEVNQLDWDLVDRCVSELKAHAKAYSISIVMGLHQPNPDHPLPLNATCLITSDGEIAGAYYKTNLYKEEKERFSAKENFLLYDLRGVKCGFLICYDSNFPALFEKYHEMGAVLLFLSYYNARSSRPKNSLDDVMRSQLITRAYDHHLYISGSNSSSRYSRMPSSFAYPDGTLFQMRRHVSGVMICECGQESGSSG
jgi:deaminated glutathione amidase